MALRQGLGLARRRFSACAGQNSFSCSGPGEFNFPFAETQRPLKAHVDPAARIFVLSWLTDSLFNIQPRQTGCPKVLFGGALLLVV